MNINCSFCPTAFRLRQSAGILPNDSQQFSGSPPFPAGAERGVEILFFPEIFHYTTTASEFQEIFTNTGKFPAMKNHILSHSLTPEKISEELYHYPDERKTAAG
jgi:hypothetical protein